MREGIEREHGNARARLGLHDHEDEWVQVPLCTLGGHRRGRTTSQWTSLQYLLLPHSQCLFLQAFPTVSETDSPRSSMTTLQSCGRQPTGMGRRNQPSWLVVVRLSYKRASSAVGQISATLAPCTGCPASSRTFPRASIPGSQADATSATTTVVPGSRCIAAPHHLRGGELRRGSDTMATRVIAVLNGKRTARAPGTRKEPRR